MLFLKNNVSFLFIYAAILCFSCKNKDIKTKPNDITPRIKGTLVFDSLPMPIQVIERVCARPIIKQSRLTGFGIFQGGSNKVVITDDSGKIVNTMELLSNGNSELVDVYFKSRDSIFSYWDYENLMLSNKNGVLNIWYLDSSKTSGYYVYTFPAVNRLTVNNKNLVMMLVNMPTGDELQDVSGVNSGKPTLGYFKLDSNQISLQSKFGVYAERANSVYYDFFSLFAMVDSESVVYCNQHQNIFYLHNLSTGETKSKALESCCFLPNNPFPPDSMNSFSFTRKYNLENARNMSLLYDPFRKYIYRVHNIKPSITSTDEVAMIEDCPLILTILDLNLDIIDEYALPQQKYNPSHFMVTPSGLLLRTISKNKLEYDVFVP